MRSSISNWRQKARYVAAMALLGFLLPATPASALTHCESYSVEEIEAVELAQRAQWLTELLEQCDLDDETRSVVYYNRGLSYGELGQFELALADFDRAIALEPDYADAYNGRASAACFLWVPGTPMALEDILTASKLEPQWAIDWQAYLSDEGFYDGPIDGNFDEASQAAFEAWCNS